MNFARNQMWENCLEGQAHLAGKEILKPHLSGTETHSGMFTYQPDVAF